MKIRIEFEIPNWTRWLAVGLIAGLAAGYGIATVRAAEVTVSTTWTQGQVLTAAALNQNFQDLRDAIMTHQSSINQLNSPDCPIGYTLDSSISNIILCKKGVDQMVKVGSGGSAFWVDRYEVGVWDHADGTGQQYGLASGDFPSSFPITGQYDFPLFAISQPGHAPSAWLTWFQADAACEASGKRLMTREEWFRASRGTKDATLQNGVGGTCLTGTATPTWRNAGIGSACVSRWGAEDMVGNLWEWTAEWYATLPTDESQIDSGYWPAGFNSDTIIGIESGAFGPAWSRLPAAASRGGSWADGALAGIFAVNFMNSPSFASNEIGVRCAASR